MSKANSLLQATRTTTVRWAQWGIKDLWRIWVLLLAVFLVLWVGEHAADHKNAYALGGFLLAVLGLGVAYACAVGAQDDFAARFGVVLSRAERRRRWLARAPWKKLHVNAGAACASTASLTASGYGMVDGSALPLDQRLKLIESVMNGLSETVSRFPANLKALEEKLEREVGRVEAQGRADTEHTAGILAGGTDDTLLGLLLGGLGAIFGTFAEQIHPLAEVIGRAFNG